MALSISVLGGLYGLGDLFKVTSLFAAASVLIYLVGWLIYARTLHAYADIPGPFWASVSRLWIAYMVERGDVDKVLVAVHKKYGNSLSASKSPIACSNTETH